MTKTVTNAMKLTGKLISITDGKAIFVGHPAPGYKGGLTHAVDLSLCLVDGDKVEAIAHFPSTYEVSKQYADGSFEGTMVGSTLFQFVPASALAVPAHLHCQTLA